MIKKTIITVVVALFAGGFLSTPAQASHCPKDVKLINAAISKMDDKKMSLAKAAAAAGLALHKAKKHGEAIKILHAAMESLGIKH
ncbi:MAG: hypothetical protein IIC56_09010 [Proteobacteria bacterium]|nr:hypothetical protein [Pseudomonadota bacterium]